MSRVKWSMVPVALLIPLSGFAATLVAMRVELQAVRAAGTETAVAIMVQIAPEDRPRLGDKALVQAELKRGDSPVSRVARSVTVGADGRVRLDVQWPPGTYQLRVDIEGTTADSTGFWVGTVTIPRLGEEGPAPLQTPEQPAAAPPAAAEVAEAPPVPAEPVPEPAAAPVGGDVTEWGSADPALADLTLVATDRNRPVLGLDRDGLKVRVDGDDAPILDFGDATTVPLYLAVAVDVSTTMAKSLPEVSRQLSRLALATLDRGGRLALVTVDAEATPVLEWNGTPSAMAEALARTGSAAQGDLAGMVTTSLALFSGHRGRKALVVVTDGGDTADRAAWKDTADAVAAAGVPILVVGLDSEGLVNRVRGSLQGFADQTGGRSYFLTSLDVLPLTLDYLAEVIDGSYGVEVRVGDRDRLHKIKMSVPRFDYELYYPRQVR